MTFKGLAGIGVAGYAEGTGTAAQFTVLYGMAIDNDGSVVVADCSNNCIRRITSAGATSTIAGSGVPGYAEETGATARFDGPTGVAIDNDGSIIVTDCHNSRIRRIASAGATSTIAGGGVPGYAEPGPPRSSIALLP